MQICDPKIEHSPSITLAVNVGIDEGHNSSIIINQLRILLYRRYPVGRHRTDDEELLLFSVKISALQTQLQAA